MIWIWIIAAALISIFVCDKKIHWYHYIWILLPIELYGVSIVGAMIKPYMIFGLAIIFYALFKGEVYRKIPRSFFMVVMLVLISDILTGLKVSSIMQHIMFVFILIIALCYAFIQQKGIEFEQIGNVAIATTIGYGIIFLIASILYSRGINMPGILAQDRMDSGIIMNFVSTGGIANFRLRGFCIDPNAVVTTLIPGAAYAFANLLYLGKNKFKSILAVILFVCTIINSGSRMGMICTLFMFVYALCIGYKRTNKKKKWILIGSIVTSVILVYIIINFDALLVNMALELNGFFNSRALLTSEYGRLTIWRKNLSYLFESGGFLTGVGQNQIYLMSSSGLACHNTWLEWICGTGLIIGTIIDSWFLFTPLVFKHRTKHLDNQTTNVIMPFIMSYVVTLICVTTIDNITNSILLFLLVVFRYGRVKNISMYDKERK